MVAPYEFGEVIGHSPYGVLKEGTHSSTGDKVSILYIKAETFNSTYAVDGRSMKKELRLLHRIGAHPHIAGVKEILQTRKGVYVVSELCTHNTQQRMRRMGGKLSERCSRSYLLQLLSGLSHVHAQGVSHNSLEPNNILLDSQGDVRLSSFGRASTCHAGACHERQNDILAIGHVLFHWTAGYSVTKSSKQSTETSMSSCTRTSPCTQDWPLHFSASLKDLLTCILSINPHAPTQSDYTLQDIYTHPWMIATGGNSRSPTPSPCRSPANTVDTSFSYATYSVASTPTGSPMTSREGSPDMCVGRKHLR